METPTITLERRCSAPDATATTWADAVAVLEAAQLSWVVTVRGDGRPHLTPLVAVWLDDAIHFATGAEEQKALNLSANPHVTVMTGCNAWDDGLDVVVEGEAVRTTDVALLRAARRRVGRKVGRSMAVRRRRRRAAGPHRSGRRCCRARSRSARVVASRAGT